jgi:hypothetical protein
LPNTTFVSLFSVKSIESDAAEKSKILRTVEERIRQASSAKSDINSPMSFVFNAPMLSDDPTEKLGITG